MESIDQSSRLAQDEILIREYIEFIRSRPDYVPPCRTEEFLRAVERNSTCHEVSEFYALLEHPDLLRRPRPVREAIGTLFSRPANLAEAALVIWLVAMVLFVAFVFGRPTHVVPELPIMHLDGLA